MLHVFGKHIGSTIEAYVDDIIVKSKKQGDLIQDLEIAFSCLRANKIKLSPEKCVFGVPRGMLLGYIDSQLGHRENGADSRHEGSAESHGVFGGTKSFYLEVERKGIATVSAPEKSERFSWTPEAEEALDNLKKTLTSAPVLVPPQPAEPLLLYVASTTQVVSAAVVVERQKEGHALPVQRPVYFISMVLSETKARYPQIQKLIYTVILT